jgi:hypothetical protein
MYYSVYYLSSLFFVIFRNLPEWAFPGGVKNPRQCRGHCDAEWKFIIAYWIDVEENYGKNV